MFIAHQDVVSPRDCSSLAYMCNCTVKIHPAVDSFPSVTQSRPPSLSQPPRFPPLDPLVAFPLSTPSSLSLVQTDPLLPSIVTLTISVSKPPTMPPPLLFGDECPSFDSRSCARPDAETTSINFGFRVQVLGFWR